MVSWSNTQIVATVAANAQSGNARVLQNGQWSNSVAFTVVTPTITDVERNAAAPGDTVTISGLNFGDSQSTGQVWLGTTAAATVTSWNDAQIVATVAANAQSGNAQVLQNGVMSNAVDFTVNIPQITGIDPVKGVAGASVTFTGSGFGAAGSVTLGSMAGQVQSWSDTQVVAQVASGSVSGIARIQRSDGLQSNALGFTVPPAGGGGAGMATALMPSLLNLEVGDTRTLQALGVDGKAVTGQTWSTSDATVVSLSADDPPLLTALAPGHVTIQAGSASADVTVWAGALPVGTTVWSNPGNGSGVQSIVPAVPSPNGVADVFAFMNDGTVQAITADGTTAWTADVSQAMNAWPPGQVLPDFQGGLVVAGTDPAGNGSIWRLDGIKGTTYGAYSCGQFVDCSSQMAVHPDGTVFAMTTGGGQGSEYASVVGIDPTGTQKFSIGLDYGCCGGYEAPIMIAGDGYAYYAYADETLGPPGTGIRNFQIEVLRIGSDGTYDTIPVYGSMCDIGGGDLCGPEMYTITNADQGIVLTWGAPDGNQMATITGTSVSLASGPAGPGDSTVAPVLQAQDGSFIGTDGNGNMLAFDASGNIRWSVPSETPAIATADGGVIGASGTMYDANGMATGSMGPLPTYSWKGAYQVGSVDAEVPEFDPALMATSYAAVPGGNLTGNGFSLVHHTFGLVFCGPPGGSVQGPYPWDGQCDNLPAGISPVTPMIFSYLPASQLNGQTYSQAADFRNDFPAWPNVIKAQAYAQYKAAFDNLPAIVARQETTSPMYGGSSAKGFGHTVYVSGWWNAAAMGQTPQISPPCSGFTKAGSNPDCPLSYLYYLSYMEQAQQALASLLANDVGWPPPVSPQYPPTDPTSLAHFQQLMTTIGFGIGTGAAHETGHQLFLPNMDCGKDSDCLEGRDARVYENYNGTSRNEWFYGNLPTGPKIHWSPSTVCALESYLLGQTVPCK